MQDELNSVQTDDSQVKEPTEAVANSEIQEEKVEGETPAKSEKPISEEERIEQEIQKRLTKRIARFTAKEKTLKEQLKEAKLVKLMILLLPILF